ncbi:MAG TPA: hypothetical protein VFG91_13465 [Woeseiaceae bacterium]|nr:hypothetical protein [Woeseiaceae bacterium]
MRKQHLIAIIVASGLAWSAAALSQPPGGGAKGLVDIVRDATERFRDLSLATAEGYGQFLGCVSAPEHGAMGVHFANGTLVGDDVLNAEQPEVLVYEPQANGGLRLAAVEFLVIAEAWHASHTEPPVLAGQSFHFIDSPNRFGLPPFYELHVWAWKHNPHGSFVNWNPNVTCEEFAP